MDGTFPPNDLGGNFSSFAIIRISKLDLVLGLTTPTYDSKENNFRKCLHLPSYASTLAAINECTYLKRFIGMVDLTNDGPRMYGWTWSYKNNFKCNLTPHWLWALWLAQNNLSSQSEHTVNLCCKLSSSGSVNYVVKPTRNRAVILILPIQPTLL